MDPIEPLAALPIFFNLRNRPVFLAGEGGGTVWKAELLAATGAKVKLFSTVPQPELIAAAARFPSVTLETRAWRAEDLAGAALAIFDARDDEDAQAFVAAARKVGVPVNVVDRPEFCDFSFGTIVNRSPLILAISTGGAAPVFGQALRIRLEAFLPRALKAWAAAARDWREKLAPLNLDFRQRRSFWERFVDLALGAGERAPSDADFDALAQAQALGAEPSRGRITLVGAGPGDPDLLTLKAVKAFQSADVILHDALTSPAALELARREARRIDVGKRAGEASPVQSEITAQMVALALQGRRVVRLKGGDPCVFGRASEEVAAARAAGVEVEIVPGVTAALAAAAELGVSLTDRELAPRLQFATLHDRDGETPETLSWAALADPRATTAIYMGARKLQAFAERAIAEGLDPRTPAVYMENVGRADGRRVAAPIAELAEAVGVERGAGPTLILYGRALAAAEGKA
jgi:uroporphyrin-III C-methyltransferase/precorrin-2 dehydrogenase/sirohydrochlorin ferrochelatase